MPVAIQEQEVQQQRQRQQWELTWSGECGRTACIQGRQSRERSTLRQPTWIVITLMPVVKDFRENDRDTHHHHVPMVGSSFHLKSFTKWQLFPQLTLLENTDRSTPWIIFVANYFLPTCCRGCSPSTRQCSVVRKVLMITPYGKVLFITPQCGDHMVLKSIFKCCIGLFGRKLLIWKAICCQTNNI